MIDQTRALRVGMTMLLLNTILMIVKLLAGTFGNSYALVADGVESATDIFVSLVTWAGFHLSLRPPDDEHPFGHGRIESLAGIFSGTALLVAALFISYHSIIEIRTPHHVPGWFTFPILLAVVAVKEWASRKVLSLAQEEDSRALEGDAWHHRSDAITSGAAAVGILVAQLGGPAYAAADDWAALAACLVICFNGTRIIARSLHETLDGAVDEAIPEKICREARKMQGVADTEKCVVRKSGVGYFAELHLRVDGELPVREGHRIGHEVKSHLANTVPRLLDVVVHIEPHFPLE